MRTGNLFELAEIQLQKEVENGKRNGYSVKQVLSYAVKIRTWLDKHNTEEKMKCAIYGKAYSRRQQYLTRKAKQTLTRTTSI